MKYIPQKILNEFAAPLEVLPQSWQNIAAGSSEYQLTDREAYVQMAQLFYHKLATGDVDLFNHRQGFEQYRPMFTELFSKLATETLEFYGEDLRTDRHPDFSELEARINGSGKDEKFKNDRLKIVAIAQDLFAEFGYDLPGSFYHVHLAPIYRDDVLEIRPLRFSEQDIANARGWDASLHAQKVFPMQLTIQSISSQKGFFWLHGCGCNHGLSRVGTTESSFSYKMQPEMRQTWIRDFLWTTMYEHAFFPIVPVTPYLVGDTEQ